MGLWGNNIMAFKVKPLYPSRYKTTDKVFGLEGKRLIGHSEKEDFYEDTSGNTYSFDGKKLTPLNEKRQNYVTTLPDEKIISKEGKWYLVSYTNPNTKKTSYAVSDGWKVDTLVIYDNGDVAYDNPDAIPQKVRTTFENDLKRETNPEEYFLGKDPQKHKDYKFYGESIMAYKVKHRKTYDVYFTQKSDGIKDMVVLNADSKKDLRNNEWKRFKGWKIDKIEPHQTY